MAVQVGIALLPSNDRQSHLDGLTGFILAGLALAGSPGPATLSLAATGAAFGARRGIGYMAGINLGMVVVMAVTGSGVVGLMLAKPGVTPIVIGLSSAYFAYLALRIATAPPLSEDGGHGREPSFAGGILLSLINPKGYAAMVALFSSFVLIEERVGLDFTAKVFVLGIVMAAVNFAWLFMGAALTRFFRSPRSSRIINVAFALLLVASSGLRYSFDCSPKIVRKS